MKINEFLNILNIHELPMELEKLIEFSSKISENDFYSNGFYIQPYGRGGLETWSGEEEFLNNLIPFASANSSGSIYAIWINKGNSLSQLPIVVFGDEGGFHVVAKNILDFLHLLTYDTEITVNENEVKFNKEKDKYKESKNLSKYLMWIKENLNLVQIEDPETIIKTAQDKYQKIFVNWVKKYYKQ